MTAGEEMPDGWFDSAERIAWHCANTHRGGTPMLTRLQRHDAALDAIIEYVHEHGIPRDDGVLFRRARAAIEAEAHESVKHIGHGNFWVDPPGQDDALAEAVTDKIAAWQVAWALTDHQWEVVHALTEAIRRGLTWHEAAASLGMKPGAYRMTLHVARKKARQLWIAPGEHARGHWARGTTWDTTRNTRMAGRIRNRTRQRARRAA